MHVDLWVDQADANVGLFLISCLLARWRRGSKISAKFRLSMKIVLVLVLEAIEEVSLLFQLLFDVDIVRLAVLLEVEALDQMVMQKLVDTLSVQEACILYI